MATVTRSDVLTLVPWLLFGAGVAALSLRMLRLRGPGGRRGRRPDDH